MTEGETADQGRPRRFPGRAAAVIGLALLGAIGLLVAVAGDSPRPAAPAAPIVLDVKDFGAKGDGLTDDAAAIQAAIDDPRAARAPKIVHFPKGNYLASRPVVADRSVRLVLDGEGSPVPGYGQLPPASTITYNGAETSFLSARSSEGFTIRNLGIHHDNAAFTGILIDLSGSTDASVRNSHVAGEIPIHSAHALVSLDGASGTTVSNVHLSFAKRGIEGRKNPASTSDKVRIDSSTFDGFSVAAITNAGNDWSLVADWFEGSNFGVPDAIMSRGYLDELPLQGPGRPAVSSNFSMIGCWFGDLSVHRQHPWVGMTNTVFDRAEFRGNYIDGQIGIMLAGGDKGVRITGNAFATLVTSIDLGARPSDDVAVHGNSMGFPVLNTGNGSTRLTVAGNSTPQDVRTGDGGAQMAQPPAVAPPRPAEAPRARALGHPPLRSWASVKDFGAKGDGRTDDTAAIQAAIDSKARLVDLQSPAGGTVYFPPGKYVVKGLLKADRTYSVTLQGADAEQSLITYTGGGAESFLSARTSLGLTIRHLGIHYDNPAFTGYLLDFSHADPAAPSDAAYMVIEHSIITGDAPVHSARGLVSFYGAILGTVRDSRFGWAERGIDGKTPEYGYANAFLVEGSTFAHLSVGAITNAGQGYAILDNLFLGTAGGAHGATLSSAYHDELDAQGDSSQQVGFLFAGNWMGEAVAVDEAWVRTEHSVFFGADISRNYFGGGAAGIKLGTHRHEGINIERNVFATTRAAIDFGQSATVGVSIVANSFGARRPGFAAVVDPAFGSTSTFMAGSSPS